jgi:tyrosine-protein kinase Etk/Wzc
MEDKVSLPGVIYVLFRYRRVIAAVTAVAVLISAGVSLVLPPWYKAKATILPPDTVTSETDIAGLMRSAGYKRARLLTLVSPSDIFSAILTSHRVTAAVIDSLDLMEVYDVGSMTDVIDIVTDRRKVSVSAQGLIEIEYEDRDAALAAEVANAFVRLLDEFNRETQITSARRVREFIENRIGQAIIELEIAEGQLQEFKEATGAVFISEQARVSIETAAEIYGRIAELEVGLERLGEFATDRSPEVVDIRSQIRALEHKLAEMGYMKSGGEDTDDSNLFPKFSTAPELEKRLGELTREVEIKRSVYRVLSEQYEQAKIQEMRDTPTLQVLDWAHPPMVRSKPRRKTIVAVSGALALLLSSFVVFSRRTAGEEILPRGSSVPVEIGRMLGSDVRAIIRAFGPKRPGPQD